VKTRDLNDWLKMAVERHPPPAVGGRRVKPKYMAQTKAGRRPSCCSPAAPTSCRTTIALPGQLDPRELRPAGVPIRLTVKSNKNPFAEGEEKSGSGLSRAQAVGGQDRPRAKHARRRAAKAKAGAGAKPKLHGKDKPQGRKAKPGNPRGRAAKLARPGVKPKRASRPSSSPKRPR
jgi:GTP-binding protein